MTTRGEIIMNNLLTKLTSLSEWYLNIISIVFILLNFIIWDLNTTTIQTTQYSLYYLTLYFVLVGVIINLKKINILEYFTELVLFVLLFFILVYNSYYINMSFHGTYVDMGLRSRELIYRVFPSFFLILLMYRYVKQKSFIFGLLICTILIWFYNLIAIYGKIMKLEELFSLPILISNRYQSLLDNPNALGEYAFLGCVFIVLFTLTIKRLTPTLLLIPFMLGGMVLSGSRTAILMLGCFYILLFLYYPYYDRKFKNLLITSFFLVVGLGLLDYMFNLNIIKEQLRLDDALSGRDNIWKYMMSVISEHWLYGVGYNNSTFVLSESGEFSIITSPHNLYFAVLMEMGIIPFILMVCFFVSIILKNQKLIILHKGNKDTMFLIVFNCFYVSTLIGQFFEHGLLKLSALNTVMLMFIAVNFEIQARFSKLPKLRRLSNIYLIFSLFLSLMLYLFKLDLLTIMTINVFPLLIFIVLRFIIQNYRNHEVFYEQGYYEK